MNKLHHNFKYKKIVPDFLLDGTNLRFDSVIPHSKGDFDAYPYDTFDIKFATPQDAAPSYVKPDEDVYIFEYKARAKTLYLKMAYHIITGEITLMSCHPPRNKIK